jgi:hypothetical protein
MSTNNTNTKELLRSINDDHYRETQNYNNNQANISSTPIPIPEERDSARASSPSKMRPGSESHGTTSFPKMKKVAHRTNKIANLQSATPVHHQPTPVTVPAAAPAHTVTHQEQQQQQQPAQHVPVSPPEEQSYYQEEETPVSTPVVQPTAPQPAPVQQNPRIPATAVNILPPNFRPPPPKGAAPRGVFSPEPSSAASSAPFGPSILRKTGGRHSLQSQSPTVETDNNNVPVSHQPPKNSSPVSPRKTNRKTSNDDSYQRRESPVQQETTQNYSSNDAVDAVDLPEGWEMVFSVYLLCICLF